MDAGKCSASGPGLSLAIAKKAEGFTVTTMTGHNRLRSLPSHGKELGIEFSQDGKTVRSALKVAETGTGQYSLTYKVDAAGLYQMTVLVSKRHISGSPFTVEVGVGDACGAKCKASGEGLRRAKACTHAHTRAHVCMDT